MSGRSKGFDPLSNLFDAPAPSPSVQPEPVDPAEPAIVDKVALAKKLAAEAQAKAASQVDKVALAKRLAAEAKARAEAEQAAKVDKVALAKKLAAEAQAKANAKAQQAAGDANKAALAKALAKAAMEKNKLASAPPPAPKKRSLAERTKTGKRMSALDAARAAAADEAARKTARAVEKKQAVAEKQQQAVRKATASSGGLVQKVLGERVVSQPARVAAQRELLKALWKAHVARHVEDQNWAVAGACSAVVDALGRLGDGQLAAIPATAGDADLLVWVDLSRAAVLAVVPDGRAYLAGL